MNLWLKIKCLKKWSQNIRQNSKSKSKKYLECVKVLNIMNKPLKTNKVNTNKVTLHLILLKNLKKKPSSLSSKLFKYRVIELSNLNNTKTKMN